jgi:adenosine deaminase
VLDAVEQAQAELGISAGLLVSAHRHRSEEDAFELLRAVGPWRDRILGFGLGGPELGNPPAKFARYFAELTRQGFPVVAHAGEEAPASYVREAVEVLGVHRIDHGTSIARDETLMREVAAAGIPLTVCPLSNVRLKGVPSLAAHPLPRMLEAGVTVTLNSDDPPYFGGYLVDNYEACRETFGWSDAQVSELAAAGLRAAFLPPGRAAELSAAARRPAAPLN